MTKYIFLSLFLLLSFGAQAQIKISGQVKDLQGNSLAGASVRLTSETDSSKRQAAITGLDGKFVLTISQGLYDLRVIYTGFRANGITALSIDGKQNPVSIPPIILQPGASRSLKEVVIISSKPLIEQQTDRTVINVDAMPSAASSNTLDVLAKSPGVMIGANDDISLNGKSNVLVLIDDRPTYLSGQGLAAYLRSLPGGMLDKVELVSNPPARYDAAGGAVINIVLKKAKANGFNGALTAGYNQGRYARSNDALNINYRTPKFNLFSNLGYSLDQNFSDQQYRRYFANPDNSLKEATLQNSNFVYHSPTWNGRIGMDFLASANTTLGFILSGGTLPRTDNLYYTTMQYNGTMQLDSIGRGATSGHYLSQNLGINLNMQHKFTGGRVLTVNLDRINYRNSSDRLSPLEIYAPDGTLLSDQQRLFHTPATTQIYAGKADYTQPLTGHAELDLGLKSSVVSNDNQSDWENGQPGGFVTDYYKSDHFRYRENINAAYVSFKKDWRRWALQAGLRLENTNDKAQQLSNPVTPDTSFDKHALSWFPSLHLLYRLDSAGHHTLNLSISRRIGRPSYQQLNPFLFFQDQYSYSGGNPDLQSAMTQYAELRYSYRQFFGVTLSYGGGNDGINSLTVANGSLLITRPFNYVNNRLFGLIPYVVLNPSGWWTTHLQAVVLFQHNDGDAAGISLDQHTNVHEIETTNQFAIGKTWMAELDGFFPGSQTFGQSKNNAVYNISAAIQKKLWHDQATIRLNVNDLFYTLSMHSQTTDIPGVTAFSTRSTDSRYAGLSFTYRFGKLANARKRADDGSAEEEKSRTK